ncbi:MAG: glycosyltransferase, partial [Deltaproteobacteria bacterium]|nr:glycosyltransferase [Deltaproteobacteria bacterium]
MNDTTISHQPKVFIIILNWNNLQDTVACLESVKELNCQNFEIVLVDNASTDGSVQVLEG